MQDLISTCSLHWINVSLLWSKLRSKCTWYILNATDEVLNKLYKVKIKITLKNLSWFSLILSLSFWRLNELNMSDGNNIRRLWCLPWRLEWPIFGRAIIILHAQCQMGLTDLHFVWNEGRSLRILLRISCCAIKCHFFHENLFLRFGTDGWYCVTKGKREREKRKGREGQRVYPWKPSYEKGY